jgi:uncharacterized membrane protein YtjA (UPF0391 family)
VVGFGESDLHRVALVPQSDVSFRLMVLCEEETPMLYWAVVFLIIALVAALFGFGGIATAAAGIAKFLFFLFVVVFLIFLVLGVIGARRVV